MQNMSYALIAQLKQTMEIPEESKTAEGVIFVMIIIMMAIAFSLP